MGRAQIMSRAQRDTQNLIDHILGLKGVNEVVIVRNNGDIVFYKSQRPILKNSVPFLVNKARQAGAVLGFSGFSYAAMQRGKGKKMIVMAGKKIMVGIEADAKCLQKALLDKLQPLLLRVEEGV